MNLKKVIQGQVNKDFLNGVFSLMFKLGGAAIALLLNIIIARGLGADGAGLFFLAIAVVTIAATIARLGLDQVIIRNVAYKSEHYSNAEAGVFFLRALLVVFLASVLVTFIVYCVGDVISVQGFGKPELIKYLDVMLWAITPIALLWAFSYFYLGLHRFILMHFFQMVGVNTLMFVAAIIIFYFSFESFSKYFTGVYLVSTLAILSLAAIAFWGFLKKSAPIALCKEQLFLEKRWLGPMLSEARPLFGVAFVSLLLFWGGQIALGFWGEASDVAIYTLAYRTATLIGFVLMAVNSIVTPKLAAMHHCGDIEGLRSVSVNSVKLMMVFCIPVVLLMIFFPSFIMGLYGEEFSAGGKVLVILVLGQFVSVVTGPVGSILSMSGFGGMMFFGAVLSAILMIVSLIFFVPVYGAVGAAIAQSLSLSFQMFLYTYFVKKRFDFVPFNIFGR